MTRAKRLFPWILVLVTFGFVGLAIVVEARNAIASGGDLAWYDAFWPASWLGFPIVGAFIASRRPRQPIGWILLAIGGFVGLNLLVTGYARYGLFISSGELPLVDVAAWFAAWTLIPGVGLVPFLLLLFPSGTIHSNLWRKIAVGGAVVLLALVLWQMIAPVKVAGGAAGARMFENPFGLDALRPIADTVTVRLGEALLLFGLATIANALWRMRRGDPQERLQLKIFAFGAAMVPGTFLLGIVVMMITNAEGPVIVASFVLAFNGLAAAIGASVLRYRLYDVDVVVNRTLVYGALTAILAGIYLGIVFVLQSLVAGFGAESDLVVAASTLAVAALFGPLRRRVQAFIDHYFYRSKYDAARTVSEFSARLREEVDLDQLTNELATVVQRTMQPAHVSLWLRGHEGRGQS